jgi:hypothetical protein
MGEVPSIYGVYVEQFFAGSFPPLKQLKAGAKLDELFCRGDFVLVHKYNGSPACVKPTSVEKLKERGWAISSIGKQQDYDDATLLERKSRHFMLNMMMPE